MNKLLSLAEMAANVELSRGHILKQDAIIDRLTEQRHHELADQARAILITMHEHLALEVGMLARMRDAADQFG